MVDGYNLPIAITTTVNCEVAGCAVDLGPGCAYREGQVLSENESMLTRRRILSHQALPCSVGQQILPETSWGA